MRQILEGVGPKTPKPYAGSAREAGDLVVDSRTPSQNSSRLGQALRLQAVGWIGNQGL